MVNAPIFMKTMNNSVSETPAFSETSAISESMKIFVVTKLENISSMTRSLSSQCSGDFGEKSALKTVKYEKNQKKV